MSSKKIKECFSILWSRTNFNSYLPKEAAKLYIENLWLYLYFGFF